MGNEINKRHYIFVLESLKLGGAERQALLLAKYILSKNNMVTVIGFGQPDRVSDLSEQYGLLSISVPFTWHGGIYSKIKSLKNLVLLLRSLKPDVILPYTRLPNVMLGLVWRFTGAHLCVWNQRDEGRFLSGTMMERIAVRNTPLFISNSQHGADFLKRQFSLESSKAHVIYNGIEIPEPVIDSLAWREKLGVEKDAILVCMVANLHTYKDHNTLLYAWRHVLNQVDQQKCPTYLLLAGRFVDSHHITKALAFDLALGDRVKFLGKVDDISGLLNTCDIGVFSSLHEGCPNGLLECMATGLPIVATDIPGIREAMNEEQCKYLALPKDENSFAAHIIEFIRNPNLRQRLGDKNRMHIETNFNPTKMCQQTVDLVTRQVTRT